MPNVLPETQYVRERGDKVITLDQRLDNIDSQFAKFDRRLLRLERLVIIIGGAALLGNASAEIIAKLLRI